MRARFVFVFSLLVAGIVSACGGGGGGGGTPATAPPTNTMTPTPPPTSGSATITLAANPQTTAIPNGLLPGTATIPSGSGTVTFTVTTSANSNTSTLDLAHFKPRAASAHRAQSSTFNGVLYVTVTTAGSAVLNGYPGFSVSTTSTTPYYLAEYYNGYWYSVTGPSSYANGTATLLATTTPTMSVTASTPLYLAIYTGGVLPSPNPYGCVGVQGDTATRQAHQAIVGVQPINNGATFTYTGTLSDSIYRTQPCAEPTATANANVTVTVSESPDPNGGTDEDSTETDAYTTNTTQVSTVAVVSPASGATSTLNESSETSTDLSDNKTVTTYAAPGLAYTITSPLPYSGSAIANNPPASIVASFADGTSSNRTYTGTSGAYTETDTLLGSTTTDTITVNPDFSGSYNINTPGLVSAGVNSIDLTFSAPSGNMVTVNANISGTPVSLPIVKWWTQSTLYSDTVSGGAAVTSLPSGCQTISGIASYAPVVRTIDVVDPALGTTETETITSYIGLNYSTYGDVGPVCVNISDTQNLYYDFLLDTPIALLVSPNGAPLQSDTLTEQYSWSSTPTNLTRVRAGSLRNAQMQALSASIDAHNAGIRFARLTERLQRIELIGRSIATKGLGGIK